MPSPPAGVGSVAREFPVGTHRLDISRTTPRAEELKWPGSTITSRECRFDIVLGKDGRVLIRDLQLTAPPPGRLNNTDWGMKGYPAPAIAGGSIKRRELPLEIVRARFKDGGKTVEFYAHKPGTGFAVGVRWEIAALIEDRWQPISSGTIDRIDAGRDALVSRGGFSSMADKAQIKIVSPAPEVSSVLVQSSIELNPSNCHAGMSERDGMIDVGLEISNF